MPPRDEDEAGLTSASLHRIRRDLVRRITRQFAGVEYVGAVWHEDGSATVTFVTYDDNASEVEEFLGDDLDDLQAEGVRVLILPFENLEP